ncbi:ABC transporter G family member 37 [Hordeum vulgare]|nr:ABC transporter G family member 37 [Hordeum vulgare]
MFLRIGTSITVGSGAASLFWFDRWVGDTPFIARFPELFAIAVEPRIAVKMTLIYLGHLAFCRPFGPLELSTSEALLDCIAVQPKELDHVEDHISWHLEHSGCFSTKSLYGATVLTPTPAGFPHIWTIRFSLKIRMLLWQWIRGHVPSSMEVLQRNGPGDGLYPLYRWWRTPITSSSDAYWLISYGVALGMWWVDHGAKQLP